jgi:hypothetical protein
MMRLFRLRDRNYANQKRAMLVEKQIVKACRYGDRTRFLFIVRIAVAGTLVSAAAVIASCALVTPVPSGSDDHRRGSHKVLVTHLPSGPVTIAGEVNGATGLPLSGATMRLRRVKLTSAARPLNANQLRSIPVAFGALRLCPQI